MEYFTKKPWHSHRATGDYLIYDEENGVDLAIVLDRGKHNAEANARLIAQAPEMFEMIKTLVGTVELLVGGLRGCDQAFPEMRQARQLINEVTQ